ncbi:MAG: acetoin dehydrogenase dihydrolipoyllysine-residue acetyltransferase subunit [Pseudomonadota bacterium]
MPVEVIMPKVDMDMETGRISAWHVDEGAEVSEGDPLFDIETDKAAMEVESPASGRLGTISAAVGDDVPIGTAVAWVYAEGEEIAAAPARTAPAEASAQVTDKARTTQPHESEAREPATSVGDRPRATPLARRLAKQHGLDLRDVRGSGPAGRIGRVDIEAALAARTAEPSQSTPRETPAPHPARIALESTDGLAVHRAGSDEGPPLVLIHGLAGDSSGWTRLERRLGDARRIKIDLTGHGQSPQGDIRDFEDLVSAAIQAFDAEGIADAHLVGHSLGGAVALALADSRPRAVASLTLLSPAGLGAEIDGAVLRGIAKASRVESLAPWLKRLVSDPDTIGYDYAKAAMASRADEGLRIGQARMIETLLPDDTQSFDVSDRLARLTCPVRIVWGRDDAIIPWKHALKAPGSAALHLLPGVGHLPHLEAPALVADVIRAQARL